MTTLHVLKPDGSVCFFLVTLHRLQKSEGSASGCGPLGILRKTYTVRPLSLIWSDTSLKVLLSHCLNIYTDPRWLSRDVALDGNPPAHAWNEHQLWDWFTPLLYACHLVSRPVPPGDTRWLLRKAPSVAIKWLRLSSRPEHAVWCGTRPGCTPWQKGDVKPEKEALLRKKWYWI